MEGTPPWLLFAGYVFIGLIALAAVPAWVALGFLVARRPHQARVWFAGSLLSEAIVCALLCCLLLWTDLRFDLRRGLPVALVGLGLLLAGAGQFVAALRGPRRFAFALAFAVGAVAVIVAGTPLRYQVLDYVNAPLAWLDALPDWDSLVVAVPSLILAAASLVVAFLLPLGDRHTGQGLKPGTGPDRATPHPVIASRITNPSP